MTSSDLTMTELVCGTSRSITGATMTPPQQAVRTAANWQLTVLAATEALVHELSWQALEPEVLAGPRGAFPDTPTSFLNNCHERACTAQRRLTPPLEEVGPAFTGRPLAKRTA